MSLRSDLRSALIKRLNCIWAIDDMADECIRQMEWARTLHGLHWRGDGRDGTSHVVNLDDEPLSLAPDEWKP